MSLISLVYPTKHIIYQNLGEIGEMPCPTLFGGYVERLLSCTLSCADLRSVDASGTDESQHKEARWNEKYAHNFINHVDREEISSLLVMDGTILIMTNVSICSKNAGLGIAVQE